MDVEESTDGAGGGVTARLVSLCFDANDPLRLARFWAEALRWEIDDETDDEVGLVPTDGTRFGILFVPVPERKAGKNRIHLDLTTTSIDDQKETVERLVELGARHIDIGQGPDDDHVVLADPEGNEFCVIEPEQHLPRRLRTSRIDQLRRYAGGRVLLERSARMAVGLGSGRRDRDPRARRHRSVHHLGGPPLMPKIGKNRLHLDIAPPAGGISRRRSTASSPSGRLESTSAKAMSTGWSWPIPTATSSVC